VPAIQEITMATFTVNPHRLDPYQGFKFRVKWDGKVIPAISHVSALKRTTTPVEFRAGEEHSNVHIQPGATRFSPIVLERGRTHDTAFEDWANLTFNLAGDAAMSLKNYRKDFTIELLNLQGTPVMAFRVFRAWVSEYQALPDLDARADSVAIERLVVEHEGWERDPSVTEPTET
jgi:phage tail-like protein